MVTPSFADRPPALVGREREQHILRECLAAARNGHGGLALIAGEAGIGKTALAEALCREAKDQGTLVLVGRCYDLTETPPYGPWLELFARFQPNADDPPLPVPFARRDTVGVVTSQAALFQQVFDFFIELASRRPLILLLDDAHWMDAASLDLLRFLARSFAPHALLLVVTYRSDELTRRHPLFQLLPILVRESSVMRLTLHPLATRDTAALIGVRFDLPETDTSRLVAYLDEHAEGNPFFVGELLHTLEEEGVLRQREEGWTLGELSGVQVPPLLRQVIDRRVARLGDETRSLLAIAAVIGQDVPFAVWERVTEADEQILLAATERAIEAHLMSATGETMRFLHALIREALYEGIVPPRRRGLHRRVGEVLAALPNPDPDAVAYHFQQSGDERATAWLVRAGERAQHAYTRLIAADRFEAALALMEMQGADADERGWLLLRLGLLRRYADRSKALVYFEGAIQMAVEAGDGLLAASARCSQGLVLCYMDDLRRGIATIEEAVAAFEALPPIEEEVRQRAGRMGIATDPCHHRSLLSLWLANVGDYRRALPLAEEVVRQMPKTARPTLDGAFAPDAYRVLGLAHAFHGQPAAAREAFARSCAAYRGIGEMTQLARSVSQELRWAVLPYQTDDLIQRERLMTERAEIARRAISATHDNWRSLIADFPVLVLEGKWDDTFRLLREIEAQPMNGPHVFDIASISAPLCHARGDAALAWAHIRSVLPEGEATIWGGVRFSDAVDLLRLGAALYLDDGNLHAANAWLDTYDRWLEWAEAVLGQSEGHVLRSRYHFQAGDMERAFDHAERALACASKPRQPLALLAAHRLLGELDTEAGMYEDAMRHLDASLALADACRAPYERALTLLATAELRAAMGDKNAARTLLDEVCSICEPLGAKPALARADALIARLDAARVIAPAYPAGLSAREVEVLRLVAQGLTNPQVAERLYLSPRTVEQHLRSIYNKLGVATRAAATAFAVQNGLA